MRAIDLHVRGGAGVIWDTEHREYKGPPQRSLLTPVVSLDGLGNKRYRSPGV